MPPTTPTAQPVATRERRLIAVARAHQLAGRESPIRRASVHAVLKGIRRIRSVEQRQTKAITVPILRQMLALLPASPLGIHDRALLLLGFAGALRRSEIVALDLGDRSEQDTQRTLHHFHPCNVLGSVSLRIDR